jgi:4-hydroxy-tetrahydrodipicolinate synthase
MASTLFNEDLSLDLDAFRVQLQRMVDANVGVYLGSGGAGEGHALSIQETRQLYDVGVEVCKGKVPLAANPREPRTAHQMLELALEVVDAGVDIVQIYPMDAGHGMRPTLTEQEVYYRFLLEQIHHPIAISVHVAVGYTTPIELLVRLTKEFDSIVDINVMGPPLSYFVELLDALHDSQPNKTVRLYVGSQGLLPGLHVGAFGCLQAEANLVPKHSRRLADAIISGERDEISEELLFQTRFLNIVNQWTPSTARWVKMAQKVLGLGNGVLREPYVLPDASQLEKMDKMFQKLGVKAHEGL